MKNRIKVMLALCFFSQLIIAQNLSIQETVDYINEKLSCKNEAPIFKITINNKGWMESDGRGVYISDLKSDGILVQDEYHWILIQCKKGNCFTNNLNYADSHATFSMCWYLSSDDKEKLGKAFSYLIKKYNEENSNQESNDPPAGRRLHLRPL